MASDKFNYFEIPHSGGRRWFFSASAPVGHLKKGDKWTDLTDVEDKIWSGTAWQAPLEGSTGVFKVSYDAAAYMTITQADGGGVTFDSVSDGTASFTFSDPVVLGGRLSTSTVAGANVELGATYAYSEAWENRYRITDWTGIGSSFKAFYFRAENYVAGSNKGLRTAEFYAADYDFGIGNIQVIYADLLLKGGDTAVAYGGGNAIEACISPEGGAGAITVTDYLAGVRINVSSNNRFDATNAAKLHGLYILARDGDGGSSKLGYGIYMASDPGQSGTRTLTTGLYINIGCTTGINISTSCAKAITVGTESLSASGSGIAIDGVTKHSGTEFYFDDGGVKLAAGYTEAFRTGFLVSTAITTADVSIATSHDYVYLAADVTTAGGISGTWGSMLVKTGVTITTSSGVGDFSGAHFTCDVPSGATIGAGTWACGVSMGGNLGGTHTGKAVAFRVRTPSAGEWDALCDIPGHIVGGNNGIGADTYIDIYIDGVAARIAAKYVA